MKKITVFFLVLILFTMLSARSKFNESTIKAELRKPGVKLVAIDFYMTGCAPCDAAIPEWKKLKKQYGDALKLIVVAPMLDNGSCMVKDWRPDKMICDEDMEIAGSWGVKDFPQAFLYSWHNNDPLVQLGHVKDVEKAIKAYFKEIPRVVLDADSSSRNLVPKVEEALRMNSKIELVSSAAEQKQLLALKKQSHQLNYDEDLKCELGKEISANSVLKITKEDGDLVLRLSSVEKSCTMAAATKSLSGNKEKLKTEVAAAVYELLSQMFGNISTPDEGEKPQKMQKSNFQTGRFGGKSDDWEVGGGEETIVKFESEPTGAVVIADGKILCQSTPCSKMLTQGNHEIEMQKENYVPNSQKQNIKEGQTIKYKLEPDFAWLSVTGNYAVSLKLDGQNIGEIPIKERPISTGNHRIEHSDNCFYDSGETFTIQRGEKKNIRFDLEHRESAIKVYVQDENGNDIDGDVFVDDKKVGRAPGTFKVPLCSKKLLVKNGEIEYSEELLLKEKQVKTLQAQLKRKGLQWSNEAPNDMTWNDAQRYCANLSDGGYSDWRLPNIDELRTLIQNHSGTQTGGKCQISDKAGKLAWSDWTKDCNGRDGSISKLGDIVYFWSSSVLSDIYTFVWYVDFRDGYVNRSRKHDIYYVRCVRNAD